MRVVAEIELDKSIKCDLKSDKYLLLHSNTQCCNVGKVKVLATEEQYRDVADAMRHALGDNPCIFDENDNTYHFSDKDLVTAFMAAKMIDRS